MMTLFAAHAMIDLVLDLDGDLEVDGHHSVEDAGIVLGQAFARALGDKKGIRRYGFFLLPMDETLCQSAIDFSGRPSFVFTWISQPLGLGISDLELVRSSGKGSWLPPPHAVSTFLWTNGHHVAEAIFKSTARAIRAAIERTRARQGFRYQGTPLIGRPI